MYMILDASNLMFVNDITEPVLFDLVWYEQDCRGYYFPLDCGRNNEFLVHTQENALVKCVGEKEAKELLIAYHTKPEREYYSVLECAKMRQFRREPA